MFDCAFSEYGSWSGRHCDEYLRDVERTFHVLDGREQPDRYAGIIGAIDQERTGLERKAWVAASEFCRAKDVKNGNIQIWFKRNDLFICVNTLVIETYGIG